MLINSNNEINKNGFPFVLPSDFMGALPGNLKLRELSLLGSHDAGTYSLSSSLGISPDMSDDLRKVGKIPLIGGLTGDFMKPWSVAQATDIKTQLQEGVRYLDLRVAVDPDGQYRICHGLYGTTIDDVLQQVNAFLTAHPGEDVILDFQHLFDQNGNDMSPEEKTQLMDKVQQILGNKIAPSSYGADVTLGQLRQNQKQAIVLFGDSSFAQNHPDTLWDRNQYISSNWLNKDNWNDLENGLNQVVDQQPNNQFSVDQAILTPDKSLILKNIFSSLLSKEKDTDKNVANWYRQEIKSGHAGNILMVDNVNASYLELMPMIEYYDGSLKG